MNNNKIEKNGIITFKYNMYDKNGNWMSQGGPVTMVIGNDEILFGISNALLGLDYTIKNQTIDFKYYPNKNDRNFQNVDLDLEIYSYNDHENIETDDRRQNTSHNNNSFHSGKEENWDFIDDNIKGNKKAKKEIKELHKEIDDLSAKITELNKNEALLNKKIIEISQNAQKKIDEFKISYKKRYEERLKDVKDFQLQSFFEKFLGPLNNLYMAVEFGVKGSNNSEVVGYVKGFELLVNQMFSVIDGFGISIIEPKIGDNFDPALHNIVELVESNDYDKDKIIEIKNRGYELNGRVIVPANVSVSAKK